jgi:hypothetical protein
VRATSEKKTNATKKLLVAIEKKLLQQQRNKAQCKKATLED